MEIRDTVAATRTRIPGRGTVIEYDDERYLHEDVSREIARFFGVAVLLVAVAALALGVLLGHLLW